MNNKKIIILFLSIFVLTVGCILGVYLFTHKEEKKEEKNSKKEVITYEVTDNKILDILKMFDGPGCDSVIEIFINDHTVYANDIPSLIAASVPWNRGDLEKEGNKIPLEQYTKYVQKYFGNDYKFEPKKGDSLLCIWSYDENEKAFIKELEPACGCTSAEKTVYRVVKAIEENDVLEIDLRVIFYRDSTNSYYADYEATRSIPTTDSFTDESFNQSSLYRMIFKKINNNYIFVLAEKAK